MDKLEIIPITFKEAKDFVNKYHRHHKSPQGMKFCIGLSQNDILIGVAIAGRPVSRFLDDGLTIEITRLCTLNIYNSCSKLYSHCVKIAKYMGYRKVITYTLASENGSSLKASGFKNMGLAGGTHWTGKRNKSQQIPFEMKNRWELWIN